MTDDLEPRLAWEPAATVPQLGWGEVHVWGWSLVARDAEDLVVRLSVLEAARARRFAHRDQARRYIVAHARMRQLLQRYTGSGEVALGTGVQGKPYIVGDPGLEINLSHAGNLAVLAVGRGVSVGVDVEEVRLEVEHPLDQLAPAEQTHLNGLRGPDQAAAFYHCWTRKEALLKGIGLGLRADLRGFWVLPGADRATIDPAAEAAIQTLGEWRVRPLEPAPGYVGCLATRAEAGGVRCLRMEPAG